MPAHVPQNSAEAACLPLILTITGRSFKTKPDSFRTYTQVPHNLKCNSLYYGRIPETTQANDCGRGQSAGRVSEGETTETGQGQVEKKKKALESRAQYRGQSGNRPVWICDLNTVADWK